MDTIKKISEERFNPQLAYSLPVLHFRPALPAAVKAPTVYIHSEHPLAKAAIESILASVCNFRSARPIDSQTASSLDDQGEPVVAIVDICSVSNWPELVTRILAAGSFPVALLPSNMPGNEDEQRALYLGVRGIVTFPNLEKELPAAVRSVAEGKLWISRDTLDEYVRRTNLLLGRLQGDTGWFTAREEQIVRLVTRGFSNKQMGSILQISERTVKFHISNILRKTKVANREALMQKAGTGNEAVPC